jgi:hypothetical protein
MVNPSAILEFPSRAMPGVSLFFEFFPILKDVGI